MIKYKNIFLDFGYFFKVTPYLYMDIVGFRRAEFTLVDYPTVDDKVATPLKSSGRLKQEMKTTQSINFRRISYTVIRPNMQQRVNSERAFQIAMVMDGTIAH